MTVASQVSNFTDPHSFQAAFQDGQVEIYPTVAGEFRAQLTKVCFPQLWMQRARENLPRVCLAKGDPDRLAINFLVGNDASPVWINGVEVPAGQISVNTQHTICHRTVAQCHWGMMSLSCEDLAQHGYALRGRELSESTFPYAARPTSPIMSRLLILHEKVGQLAAAEPKKLARPEVALALEQELIGLMVSALAESSRVEPSAGARHRSDMLSRLEAYLVENHDRAANLAEVCAAIGVSDRTLRCFCKKYFGMGPIRYLWFRRMHLARRALVLANPAATSVTEIATRYGFWELGRFSVDYRILFSESPSVTLRHLAPGRRPVAEASPLSLRVLEPA